MDAARQMIEIRKLAQRLAIEVRTASLGGDGGGMCRIAGKSVLFVDRDADIATQITQTLRALAHLPEIDNVWLTPALREQIEAQRHELG